MNIRSRTFRAGTWIPDERALDSEGLTRTGRPIISEIVQHEDRRLVPAQVLHGVRGDGRVVHDRESLSLGVEAGEYLLGVRAWLQDLERDVPSNGLRLLREVDAAHATLAEQFDEAICTDDTECFGLQRPLALSRMT